ncbi:hypothetical protein [Pedomonas mirosovicensis]|uniref:hypothetical protein n=1 Tax=Pedomonas mirosovicensis TaxID=2908641 RepID=UPI002169E755|nr:hypothetical protein [Pedomonas mirosovicensis]MCH8683937.1 hypothetical protein [Pedomonas mirosovicensis]
MNEPDWLLQFLAGLGGFGITTVSLAGTAYWLFQRYGDNWLKTKFDERLESFKHQQQQEIERLRFRFNGLLDRTVKLNQYEFGVLPEVWALLSDAYTSVFWFVHPLQSYPNLDRMCPEELEDFLRRSEFSDWEKDEIRTASNKLDAYKEKEFWVRYNQVRGDFRKFLDFFRKNKIFIDASLAQKLDEFGGLLFDALQERELKERNPVRGSRHVSHVDKLREEGESQLKAIGDAIQKRLWGMRFNEASVDV